MALSALVAGDAMLDRYWLGDASRISPEAPVPVVSVCKVEERPGGAANVARNLEAMGVAVRTLFSPSLRDAPIVKLRIVARGQQMMRLDFDPPQSPIDPEAVAAAAADCEIVVLSDYGKGTLEHIAAIIWRCKRAGKRVFVDPKGRPARDYAGADLLKPNLAETAQLLGAWSSEDELEQKVKALQRKGGIAAVLLTRGGQGMTFYNGSVTHIPCAAREVFDVSGAGDTALAAFTAAYVRGADYIEAARVANRAAGIAVSRFGTAVVNAEDIFA